MMLRLTGFFWILLAGAVFGLIHSGLASNWSKNLAARWFGERSRKYYRLFFVGIATLTTLAYLSLVILLPDELIYIIHAPWVYLTLAVQAVAVIGILVSLSQISTAGFLGLTALPWFKYTPSANKPPSLVTGSLYRWVRHPIYTCTFLFLLCMPWLSWNTLAFIIGVVVYTVIGAVFEEKKMVQEFGAAYLEYQKKTPMFLPFRLK
jgi:protein-S-isoprenylcysteine O-methyltransferase Ste14